MAAKAVRYDIKIYAGAIYAQRLTLYSKNKQTGVKTPVDLTGLTARLVIKSSPDDTAILEEFSTADSSIILGGAAGTIDLLKLPTDTAGMIFGEGTYAFYFIDASNQPQPPLFYGDAVIDYSTLPSGG